MDEAAINREGIDKLIDFLTKDKYKEMIAKVKMFSEENPEAALSVAEKFLLLLGKTNGLLENLSLWRFREDFEASEKEICGPLNVIKAFIEETKASNELRLVFAMTLKVVNFMKSNNFNGFQLEDLTKLDMVKDSTKTHSLTFHIVRKVLEAQPGFEGFPAVFMEVLESATKVDMKMLGTALEHMEKQCR